MKRRNFISWLIAGCSLPFFRKKTRNVGKWKTVQNGEYIMWNKNVQGWDVQWPEGKPIYNSRPTKTINLLRKKFNHKGDYLAETTVIQPSKPCKVWGA